MKSINFFSLLLILSAIMFLPFTTKAQVTIGSADTPQEFSILELISRDSDRGLRLPQIKTTPDRDRLSAEFAGNEQTWGLKIFNMENQCVEVWNGRGWISLCDGEVPPIVTTCDIRRIRLPNFAHFNLGGIEFDNVRDQMRHAASLTGTTTNTSHGSLFGGRFQWGRADMAHAISTDGDFTLRSGSGASAHAIGHAAAVTAGFHPVSGQPLYGGAAEGFFITSAGTTGDIWIDPNHPARNNLWGNGVVHHLETGSRFPANPGIPGVPGTSGDGLYFQSTSLLLPQNDPCRTYMGFGWRLPTQDEWEFLGAYDCNPAQVTGTFTVPANRFSGRHPSANSLFTWVRVSCYGGICRPALAADWTNERRNGYVLYLTSTLPAGFEDSLTNTTDLLADNTPEPFLFLPAAGWRSNTGFVQDLTRGSYWSKTLLQPGLGSSAVRITTFSATGVNAGFDALNPSVGMSVRCVRD